MNNFSYGLFKTYSDGDQMGIRMMLYSIKTRLRFDDPKPKNIYAAILATKYREHVKQNTEEFLLQHLPGSTLYDFLYSRGIDLDNYPPQDFIDYCIRWISHLIEVTGINPPKSKGKRASK